MFAVPGWAISADLLAQPGPTKSSKAVKSDVQETQEQAFADSKRASKKRKRSAAEPPSSNAVSAEDLEKLWNNHFGSRPAHRRSKKDRNEARSAVVRVPQHKHLPAQVAEQARSKVAGSLTSKEANGSSVVSAKSAQVNHKATEAVALRDSYQHGGARGEKKQDKKRRDNDQLHEEASHETLSKTSTSIAVMIPPQPHTVPASNFTPLQVKMRNKLTSARFRHLNQTLYTTSSSAALKLFTTFPDLFAEYHTGFSQQVKNSWPRNPVDVYIEAIKTRGKVDGRPNSLPRRKSGSCTIADLGCGDAPLARGCRSKVKDYKLKFHNFDLHAPNIYVTKADISNLPLRDSEADIAVFCLSLMGTNWLGFVEEAWRILRGDGKGEVWVAEVKSRFGRVTRGKVVENSIGKKRKQQKPREDEDEVLAEVDGGKVADETDISAFVQVFQRRGFELRPESVDKGNKMFVSMIFVKSGIPTAGKHKGKKWNGKEYKVVHDSMMRYADDEEVTSEEEVKVLKPCVYKTR